MRSTWLVWILFTLSLAVVLAVMVWISGTVLRLDWAETEARRQAAMEENIRLALWRMDTALAPLLAQETARPYFTYRSLLPVDRTYGQMFGGRAGGEVLPSPLLKPGSPYLLLHFQVLPDGRIVSPQVPGEDELPQIVPQHLATDSLERATAELARVRSVFDRKQLVALLPEPSRTGSEAIFAPEPVPTDRQLVQRGSAVRGGPLQNRGAVEFQRRDQAILSNAAVMAQQQIMLSPDHGSGRSTDVGGVVMTPLWIDGQLLLARRITVGGQEYVQGCLLDWPGIRVWLVEQIADLVPNADLQPVLTAGAADEARRLAGLPVRLVYQETAPAAEEGLSPLRLSLAVAWTCLLTAAAAAGLLLWGVVRLSERRGAFVSAVTHELRTPLTTFHMYTEMLADGMVGDPRQQREYLVTLREEAARLTHLVENVLAYARLERGRKAQSLEAIPVGQLLGRCRDRLDTRARQAGMELVVETSPAVEEAIVRANLSAVEQILLNLVDNACKYAGSAPQRRIHLSTSRQTRRVEIRVRDHGPGVPSGMRRRLFRSFSKSAHEAACSAPGIGLGLALSRRLAKDMGGRLELERNGTDGACFVLALPSAKPSEEGATGVDRETV